MPYVIRDENERITAIYNENFLGNGEPLEGEALEIFQFFLGNSDDFGSMELLSQTDIGLVRVVEDVIEALIDKNILAITDLPEAAMDKLLTRRKIRDKMNIIGKIVTD